MTTRGYRRGETASGFMAHPGFRLRLPALMALLLSVATELSSEQITLTTWYPSPAGFYQQLLTTGGSSASPVNTILSRDAGNVGIGTANPANSVAMDGGLAVNGRSSTQFVVQKNGAPGFAINTSEAVTGDVTIYDRVGGSWNQSMNLNSGNVGIGGVTPTYRLDVNGDANIRGTIHTTNGIGVGYTVVTAVASPNNPSVIGARCPNGTVPIGGGCSGRFAVDYINASYPNGTVWECIASSTVGSPQLTAYAICAQLY